jgi:hypothetical protein
MTEREALEWMTALAGQMRGLLQEASDTLGDFTWEVWYRGEPDEQFVHNDETKDLIKRIDELLANTTPKEGE